MEGLNGDISIMPFGRKIIIKGDFQKEVPYSVKVSKGIKSISGNQLNEDYTRYNLYYIILLRWYYELSEPPTTDTLRVLESQGSWVVVASVSQLNLPSYPHSSYGSYIIYLSTYP